jgi:D-glycero-D-manno-heptose 1,7-bisphosphate phosphatase
MPLDGTAVPSPQLRPAAFLDRDGVINVDHGYTHRVDDLRLTPTAAEATLKAEGAHIDAFYYCAYHPEGTVPEYAREHDHRKPGPGMLLQAMRDLPIDATRSFMIGDKPSDAEAAARAGIPSRLIVANDGDLAAAVREMIA